MTVATGRSSCAAITWARLLRWQRSVFGPMRATRRRGRQTLVGSQGTKKQRKAVCTAVHMPALRRKEGSAGNNRVESMPVPRSCPPRSTWRRGPRVRGVCVACLTPYTVSLPDRDTFWQRFWARQMCSRRSSTTLHLTRPHQTHPRLSRAGKTTQWQAQGATAATVPPPPPPPPRTHGNR